ncbi:MAG: ABC transporter substrate-binding protein, partial [Candidatus Dormibacteraeota bacterium]|nr:ABC transporter substrate-binding protein [Candidatus Dormibacteraeota bacterium]
MTSSHTRQARAAALALAAVCVTALVLTACGGGLSPLRIGAVFPLSGPTAAAAQDEYRGVQLAAQLAGATASGRQIQLDVRDVTSTSAVQQAADSIHADGVPVVVGAYSSSLSIPL